LRANEWFGALSPADLASSFKPGFSLPREFEINPKDESRQLYQGQLEPDGNRLRIVAIEPLSKTNYRSAALLRDSPNGPLLRLASPVSALMVHRNAPGLNAPLNLVRIAPDGNRLWETNTGIGKLKQIIAGTHHVILIGERPAIPDKLSEPIMVLVQTTNGQAATVSLWR
jgi:hypothetical protein